MKIGRLLIGIMAGVAAGAFVGILFAPDKGSETRRRIIDKGNNYARNLRDRVSNIKNKWGVSGEYADENEFREEYVSPSI